MSTVHPRWSMSNRQWGFRNAVFAQILSGQNQLNRPAESPPCCRISPEHLSLQWNQCSSTINWWFLDRFCDHLTWSYDLLEDDSVTIIWCYKNILLIYFADDSIISSEPLIESKLFSSILVSVNKRIRHWNPEEQTQAFPSFSPRVGPLSAASGHSTYITVRRQVFVFVLIVTTRAIHRFPERKRQDSPV
jgi:hypothetical protein